MIPTMVAIPVPAPLLLFNTASWPLAIMGELIEAA
jgi:hypothetical protein